MAGTDPVNEISELSSTLTSVESVLDPEAMRREADNLRERAADPGLWDDQERAQAVTRRLSYLEGELSRLDSLRRRLDDTRVMFELAESEHDEPTREEATRDLAVLRKEIDQLEVRTLLSGEYDAREALITINAQAGGADAADWAGGCGASTCAGRSGTGTPARSTTPPTRKKRASSPPRSRSRRPMPTARCAVSTARTGWCVSPSTTTRAAGRPRSPGWT
jgi:hypothetical protein